MKTTVVTTKNNSFQKVFCFREKVLYLHIIKNNHNMNQQTFIEKYQMDTDIQDVLLTIASNLSDLQIYLDEDSREKVNSIKEFIFDYRSVTRKQLQEKI